MKLKSWFASESNIFREDLEKLGKLWKISRLGKLAPQAKKMDSSDKNRDLQVKNMVTTPDNIRFLAEIIQEINTFFGYNQKVNITINSRLSLDL